MAPAEPFERNRARLLRLAHRMLGSVHEAEDVLQDAYLRWHEADGERVRVPEAFLVTTVTRLALDRLRRGKTERAAYIGQWLPEPWMVGAHDSEPPDAREERSAELGYAALVLLSQLSPEERAAFLLREVFELDYAQVAEAVERNEAAVRKLVQRAHEHLADKRPRHPASPEQKRELLERFRIASTAADAQQLTALLSPLVSHTADGGGKVFAGRDVLRGAARIAHLTCTVAKKTRAQHRLADVDGEPALATFHDGTLVALTFFEIEAGSIREIFKILNPDKLAAASRQLTA